MVLFSALTGFVMLSSLAKHDTLLKNKYISNAAMFFLLAIMIVYIPFLDFYVSDMVRYVAAFREMHYLSLSEVIFYFREWEPFFLLTQWFISRFTENQVIFVLFNFSIYTLIIFKIVKNTFDHWQRMFAVFVFFCFPFLHMFVFDALRQGIAMLLLILATNYWFEDKQKHKFSFCLIAAGLFHYTAFIMSAIILIIALFKLRLRTIMIIWFITAFLFITGINATILNFGFISSIEYVDIYTDAERITKFGEVNKINFFIFTAFFLFVSLILLKYLKLDDSKRNKYLFICKVYTGFSSAFLLFGFIAYSNRIAMYSWFLIPLLISYPVLHKKIHSNILLFGLVTVSFIASFYFSPFIAYK